MNRMQKINLINGDCRHEMAVMKDNSFDVTFTSPPYNRRRNDKYLDYNDRVCNYGEWLGGIIDNMLRVTERHVIVNIQKNYYNKADVFSLIGKYSDKLQEVIIWEKTNPMPASGKSITNSWEFFLVMGDEALKSNTTYTKNILSTSVNGSMPKHHKAVMKQEVSDWFIEKFTKEGDHVLDPFMGLGTTGKSCVKFERTFTGIEKSLMYFSDARKVLT